MLIDVDFIPGGLIVLDTSNKVTAVNQSLCDWLGREKADLQGHSPERWMTVASRMYYLGHVLPSLRLHGRAEEVFLSLTNANGEVLPVILSASVCLPNTEGYQLLILPMQRRNLIEEQLQQARKHAEMAVAEKERALQAMQALTSELELRHKELATLNQQLERLATQDALTGLDNRRVYDREMAVQFSLFRRVNHPFALIVGDIDYFKDINDSFGHDAGDQVLKEISQQLSLNKRELDTLARIGGEEFALILPNTTAEQAFLVAERKRKEIEQFTGQYGSVTLSFGVAEVRSEDTQRTLYERADQALYKAKKAGKNQVGIG